MHTVRLRFTKLELVDYNRATNNIRLHLFFEENGKMKYAAGNITLTEDVEEFVKDFITGLRTNCKKRYMPTIVDDDDVLGGYVNILIEGHGEVEGRLANAIKKFRDSIRGFRSVKSASGYMDKYHMLHGQTFEF